MAAPDFWTNRERAQADVEEVSRLRSLINPFQELEREIEDFNALQELAAEETDPAHRTQAEKEVATEHDRLAHKLDEFELRQFFSGENDRANAFLTIHSGAGGTESCDWADMLLRMYQRWIERSGFKSQTVDIQQGEEVGIKSVTLLVTGEYAYGFCRPSAECIGSCASRRSMRTNGGTRHSPASMLCRKSRTLLRSKLIRPICRSTRFAAAAKAGKTSTKLKLPCESCTCPVASWWPARPSAARDEIANWR